MRVTLLPSIADLILVAVLVWLFAASPGRYALLADGDTGWHIRNGQEILNCRCVPHQDSFAFGTDRHPWFAWEWLTDVIFAGLHRVGGLKAIVLFSGTAIAATASIVFRHMLWRGSGPFISLGMVLLATGASAVHFLARPHVLTLLLLAGSAWALDRDRRCPSRWIWILPAVVGVWTNLHGGFLAIFPILALRLAETVVLRPRPVWRIRRDLALFATCALATLMNPYGWRLHQHLLAYLQSDWIRRSIEEFQSPRFQSEGMFQFEMLLLCGIAILPALLAQRKCADACLVLFWAHEALCSVRHVPIYCLMAAPIIGSELSRLAGRWALSHPRAPVADAVYRLNADWSRRPEEIKGLPAAIAIILLFFSFASEWPKDFPESMFPVAMLNRNLGLLATSLVQPARIFSTDQWSDYLIYRLYPKAQTFFDGRSDFLGPWRGDEYALLMNGRPNSPAILEREHVGFALIPSTWALAGMLTASSHWEQMDVNRQAILFRFKNSATMR